MQVIELFSYNGVVVPGLPNLEKHAAESRCENQFTEQKNLGICRWNDTRVSDNDNDVQGIPRYMGRPDLQRLPQPSGIEIAWLAV